MTTPVATLMSLQGRILDAVEPLRDVLAPAILRKVALAEVAAWVDAQDESIRAERVVEIARAAVAFVNTRF